MDLLIDQSCRAHAFDGGQEGGKPATACIVLPALHEMSSYNWPRRGLIAVRWRSNLAWCGTVRISMAAVISDSSQAFRLA